MLYSRQAVMEGLSRQGIMVSSLCRNHRPEGWQVTSIEGQPAAHICCKVFDHTRQAEANREYIVTKKAHQQDPLHFVDGLREPVPFMVRDETGEHSCTALLMEKSMLLSFGHRSKAMTFYVQLMAEIAQALQTLHGMGCLHTEVSPDHIVLQNGHYRLTGLGALENSRRTFDQFTAPEVWDGLLMKRSDLFSLGMTLRFALTGGREAAPRRTSAEQLFGGGRRLLPARAEECDDERFWKIIRKASAFFPSERYRCAEELLEDLAAYAAASGIYLPLDGTGRCCNEAS